MEKELDIQYYAQDRFGIERFYPVSKDAQLVCVLMDTKEITDKGFRVAENYGATFTEVLRPR